MSENKSAESGKDNEPKIVVDDDWKAQVAKEKEAAARAQQAGEPMPADEAPPQPEPKPEAESATESPAAESPAAESPAAVAAEGKSAAAASQQELPPPPPASFDMLISMLFTQAMAMLGHMPDPSTSQTIVNKPYAKHYIDTLEMLGEKTKGNLSEGESKMLSEALHAMRMAYVGVK